jgi:hypothetical protein
MGQDLTLDALDAARYPSPGHLKEVLALNALFLG